MPATRDGRLAITDDDDRARHRPDDVREWALSTMRLQPSEDGHGIADQLYRLVRAASAGLGLKGASVTLKSVDGAEAVVAASDETSRGLAELEFGVGQGPACDAFARGRPVLVSELGGHEDGVWPGYSLAAQAAGVGAVFAFPLQLGASRFGVLSMFADEARWLDRVEMSKCLVLSELATEMLLNSSAATGDGEIDPDLKGALGFRGEIYQAQGMMMVKHGLALPEALALMRAHAFATGRHLVDVSVDIVQGQLHLAEERPD